MGGIGRYPKYVTDVVREQLAFLIAGLPAAPQANTVVPRWGDDLACLNDIDSRASFTTGEAESVAQDAWHRLITKALPGDDPAELNFGIDLFERLHEPLTDLAIGNLENEIAGVIARDERIATTNVTVTSDVTGSIYEIVIRCTLSDSTSFTLIGKLGTTGITSVELST